MKPLAAITACLTLLVPLSLAGCAAGVPAFGKPELTHPDQADFPAGTLVSTGPRKLIELLTDNISTTTPGLTSVDSLLFRDTAFPEGGWQLQALLDEDNRAAVVRELQVDYLVLVTPLDYSVDDEHGFFLPLVAGAQSAEHKATLSATIHDLRTGAALCRIRATAAARERVLYYVIFFGVVEPQVVAPLIDALTRDIVNVISTASSGAPARIAVLAAEPPDR